MGVPVDALAPRPEHDRHAGRVGMSLLTAAGLPELLARDEDDYVRLAPSLAHDGARLDSLRAGLRERVVNSPLCDTAAFGARLGDAIRMVWREWCHGADGV